MKKVMVAVTVLAGVGVLLKRLMPTLGRIDWEHKFESMPDNAPPKWMFRNITAIRHNTERIIELLEGRSHEGARSDRAAPAAVGARDGAGGNAT